MTTLRLVLVVSAVLTIAACSPSLEWEGKIAGNAKVLNNEVVRVGDEHLPPPEPIFTGTVSAAFEKAQRRTLKLAGAMPLSDCVVEFFDGTAKRDDSGVKTGM